LGRGEGLYGVPDHDSALVRRHFGPIALGGFFWLASSGVHGMMDAFERALSVPTRRPYWKKRLLSLAFVAGASAVFGCVQPPLDIEPPSTAAARLEGDGTIPRVPHPPRPGELANLPGDLRAVPPPTTRSPWEARTTSSPPRAFRSRGSRRRACAAPSIPRPTTPTWSLRRESPSSGRAPIRSASRSAA
jgi:hypothetical protein